MLAISVPYRWMRCLNKNTVFHIVGIDSDCIVIEEDKTGYRYMAYKRELIAA